MIRIICVGKLKDNVREVAEKYVKRISNYTKIDIIEINEYKSSNVNESLKKESERILKKTSGSFIVLDEKGKQLNSKEFSGLLKNTNITFVIGSHVGLSEEIKNKAENKISISKMTLPHQFARVILLEQIYRGFTILKNQPYHK